MPNYYLAPAQPYPIGYPLCLWPPYQQYYTGPHGHVEEDSEQPNPMAQMSVSSRGKNTPKGT